MDINLFREQLDACLQDCFLIELKDTNLPDETIAEACQSGEQPFEMANYFAEKHGLARGDKLGRFGTPEYKPMTLADQERAISSRAAQLTKAAPPTRRSGSRP